MRFGVYAEMQCPDGKSHQELYWDIFRQMVHADEVGFDTYALIEHHFFPNFGISTNPLAMFTAVAQKTKRIRFRTALHTLPLHNPLKLAGEIAAADILTNGRLECGVGVAMLGFVARPISRSKRADLASTRRSRS